MNKFIEGRKAIGQGGFTVCYEGDNDKVILRSVDPIKSFYCNKGIDNRFFPRITRLGKKDGHTYYEQDRVVVLTQRGSASKMNDTAKAFMKKFKYALFNDYKECLHVVREEMSEFPEYQKAIHELLKCMWGKRIRFAMEFWEMNIGVDPKTGDLIFFDLFYPCNTKAIVHTKGWYADHC